MGGPSLTTVIDQLEDLFLKLNIQLFGSCLEKPIITVAPDRTGGAYGWCTSWKAWEDGTVDGYYEINICAEYLDRPLEEICATLLHEMVHLFNLQRGVKDCSRNGYYHNKQFKKTAEAHGLIVEKTRSRGFAETALALATLKFVKTIEAEDFTLVRPKLPAPKGSSNSIRYVCPTCGFIARTTRRGELICGACQVTLQEE